MADVRCAESGLRETTHSDHAAASRELARERQALEDLIAPRQTVRRLGAGVRGDDVPEQDALLEPELGQHAMDDRRAGLGWAGPRQLALGGERNPGDARASITRG